ncbi:ABC transporter permease subunit [Actinoplanes sp. NPDC049265]|uniref:ABC transporter permease subunit n=1 Tax=Actinoplanes sp. NPDC049265 TaxID=3363902 RepID=UPI003722EB1B
MSLAQAELRRLTKRRFVRWLTIGTLVVMVVIAVGIFLSNQKVGPEQVAQARAAAEQDYQEALRQAGQDRANCERAPGTNGYPADCTQLYQPQPQDFPPDWHMPSTFRFKNDFGAVITTFAAIFVLLAFVVGASYVGAEWSSGGMMNLLLWRPRRLQVLGTKLGVLLGAVAALSVVVAVLWTLTFLAIAELHGTTEGMTAGAWRSTALTEVRAIVLILLAAAIGFGLASLGRHTAVALGVAAGVVVVLQFGLYLVLNMAEVPFGEVWLLPIWAVAWMNKEFKLEDYNSCQFSSVNGCQPDTLTLTWPMAGALWAAIFVVIVGAALWTMRKRDIA